MRTLQDIAYAGFEAQLKVRRDATIEKSWQADWQLAMSKQDLIDRTQIRAVRVTQDSDVNSYIVEILVRVQTLQVQSHALSAINLSLIRSIRSRYAFNRLSTAKFNPR